MLLNNVTVLYAAGIYRIPQKTGACAIGSPKQFSGGRFHQLCHCNGTDLSTCKSHCDTDENCKGYVKQTSYNSCQIATTSTCPSGCTMSYIGNTGALLTDKQLFSEDYDGCFIKITGKL